MQKLLMFLLFSAVFVIGYMGFIKVLWAMMQEDQAFDAISSDRFTALKERLYAKSAIGKLLCKILGDCEQCTAFWWAIPWLLIYFIFVYRSGMWCIDIAASVAWMVVFWSSCSMAGHWVLTHKIQPK